MRTTASVAEPRVAPLPVALRAWTELPPEPVKPTRRGKRAGGRCPRAERHVLVLDTETATDRSQRLNFGAYRYYRTRRVGGPLVCVEEGTFYDEELPQRNPNGYRVLWDYAKYREPAIDWTAGDALTVDAPFQIRLLTASEMRTLIYEAAYQAGRARGLFQPSLRSLPARDELDGDARRPHKATAARVELRRGIHPALLRA